MSFVWLICVNAKRRHCIIVSLTTVPPESDIARQPDTKVRVPTVPQRKTVNVFPVPKAKHFLLKTIVVETREVYCRERLYKSRRIVSWEKSPRGSRSEMISSAALIRNTG